MKKETVFKLSPLEHKAFTDYGSTAIKFELTGIGVKVNCIVNGIWVDITDYSKW